MISVLSLLCSAFASAALFGELRRRILSNLGVFHPPTTTDASNGGVLPLVKEGWREGGEVTLRLILACICGLVRVNSTQNSIFSLLCSTMADFLHPGELLQGVPCQDFPPLETPIVSPQLLQLWANRRGASPFKTPSTICSAAGKKQHFCLPVRVAGKSP